MKLRLDLLKFDDFTATKILREIQFCQIQKSPKMLILAILVNLNNFQVQNLPKFKVQSLILPKMTFYVKSKWR